MCMQRYLQDMVGSGRHGVCVFWVGFPKRMECYATPVPSATRFVPWWKMNMESIFHSIYFHIFPWNWNGIFHICMQGEYYLMYIDFPYLPVEYVEYCTVLYEFICKHPPHGIPESKAHGMEWFHFHIFLWNGMERTSRQSYRRLSQVVGGRRQMYSFPPKQVRCNSASAIWCSHKVNLDGQTDTYVIFYTT